MLLSTGIFLSSLVLTCSSIKLLPKYFHRCSISDPHFGQCVGDGANIVITKLLTGNADFGLPKLSTFPIPDIRCSPCSASVQFMLVNGSAGNLEDVRFIWTTFDVPQKIAKTTAFFPHFRITGNYELDGILGDLSVKGIGKADITIIDFYCKTTWIFVTEVIGGNRHLNVSDIKVDYEIKDARFVFSNLEGGNEASGKKASDHINKNWRILEKLISPVVVNSIRNIAFLIADSVANTIPANEIFKIDL